LRPGSEWGRPFFFATSAVFFLLMISMAALMGWGIGFSLSEKHKGDRAKNVFSILISLGIVFVYIWLRSR